MVIAFRAVLTILGPLFCILLVTVGVQLPVAHSHDAGLHAVWKPEDIIGPGVQVCTQRGQYGLIKEYTVDDIGIIPNII